MNGKCHPPKLIIVVKFIWPRAFVYKQEDTFVSSDNSKTFAALVDSTLVFTPRLFIYYIFTMDSMFIIEQL